MPIPVPRRWLSAEHNARMDQGVQAAADLLASAFPPHPEDHLATLAVYQLEIRTNDRIRSELVAHPEGTARAWWLQGLVLGFCAQAAEALAAAADLNATDVHHDLAHMAAHTTANVNGEQRAAAQSVFALVEAVLVGDDTGCAWALERLFVPTSSYSFHAQTVRVKSVCTAAVLAASSSAQIELGALQAG